MTKNYTVTANISIDFDGKPLTKAKLVDALIAGLSLEWEGEDTKLNEVPIGMSIDWNTLKEVDPSPLPGRK